MAIFLAKGERLALAPLYLRSLYASLDKCVNNVLHFVGRYDVVTNIDTGFLQTFLWETFRANAPKPVEFPTMEMIETAVGGVNRRMPNGPYMLWAWQGKA